MPTYLYFLLWGVFFFVMMRFGCGAHIMGHGHRYGGNEPGGGALSDDQVSPIKKERLNEHRH